MKKPGFGTGSRYGKSLLSSHTIRIVIVAEKESIENKTIDESMRKIINKALWFNLIFSKLMANYLWIKRFHFDC